MAPNTYLLKGWLQRYCFSKLLNPKLGIIYSTIFHLYFELNFGFVQFWLFVERQVHMDPVCQVLPLLKRAEVMRRGVIASTLNEFWIYPPISLIITLFY
jgi:hypothetical protein